MSNAAPAKFCKRCNKDVTNEKRSKDATGNYYCHPCRDAMQQKAAAPVAAASIAAPPAKAAPDAGSEYDLVDPGPVKKSRPAPAATAAPEQAAGAAKNAASGKKVVIPEFCPNCNAKTLPNRRLCIRCNRDVTQMDRLLALRAEGEKTTREEAIASTVSKVIKVGIWLFVIAFVVFSAYGLKLMFSKVDPWEHYPKTREAAVREFMGDIATGTEKSYQSAFLLVSFRHRTTTNDREIDFYMNAFRKMHEELEKKHGAGWLSKATFVRGADDEFTTEDLEFTVKIDAAEYHVGTQVQISVDQEVVNLASRHSEPYPEDGKNHFGVTDVEEYPAHPRRTDKPPGGNDGPLLPIDN